MRKYFEKWSMQFISDTLCNTLCAKRQGGGTAQWEKEGLSLNSTELW